MIERHTKLKYKKDQYSSQILIFEPCFTSLCVALQICLLEVPKVFLFFSLSLFFVGGGGVVRGYKQTLPLDEINFKEI